MQLICIIHRFCMHEFAYSVKFFVTSKSIVAVLSQPLADVHRAESNLRQPSLQCPVWSSVQCSAFLFYHFLCKQASFSCSIWCHTFPHLCTFSQWFHGLKWPVSIVLKFCLVFLGTRMLWYALRRKCICQCYECMFHDAVFPISHPLVPAQVILPGSQEPKAPIYLYISQPYRWPWHQGITVSQHRWLGYSHSFYYSRFNLNPY